MKEFLAKMVRIISYRSQPRDRTCKVVEVRDTHEKPLKWKSYKSNAIPRSRYLLTVQDLKTGEYRSYYHEYVVWKVDGVVNMKEVATPTPEVSHAIQPKASLLTRLKKWWEEN